MIYVQRTEASVDHCVAAVEAAAAERGFGVLHVYDFRKILADKGFPINRECRVLEVCSPAQASQILETDMDANLALPCRISVYEDGGSTYVGMIRPTSLVGMVSQTRELWETAEDVDKHLVSVIDQAAGALPHAERV